LVRQARPLIRETPDLRHLVWPQAMVLHEPAGSVGAVR